MKKHNNSKATVCFVAILSASVVLFTSACSVPIKKPSNGETGNGTTTSDSGPTEEADNQKTTDEGETTYKIGDTVNIDDWEITVNSVEVADKITNKTYGTVETYFSPDEGNKYIVFNMTIKNLSTDSNSFLSFATLGDHVKVKIEYQEYEFNSTNLMGHDDELHMTTLNPLSSKTGILAFSIAEEVVNNFDALKLVLYTKNENCVFLMGETQGETET